MLALDRIAPKARTLHAVFYGAAIAALFLMPFLNHELFGWVLAFVAGIMVSISLDELIPAAKEHGSEHAPIVGAITGMAIMALSLLLLTK